MNDNFYKSIIKESPMGYAYHKIICDSEGKPCDYEFLEVNSAFEKYIGLKADEIIGKKVTDVMPRIEKDEFDWIGFYGKIALNDGIEEFDQFSEVLNKHYRVKAFSPEKGYFITLFYDITEEIIDKEQKEAKFKKLFENMQSGAAIYSVINDGKFGKDYIIKDFNKESLRIEGKTKEEVIGKSLLDLRPNIDEYGLIDVFREVWKTGESKKYPSKVYVDDKYNNYYENDVFKLGENEIVAIYNDVTQIMQTQEELKESRNKFKQYIDRAPYGVMVVDENGKFVEVNEATCKIIGYTNKEMLKKGIMNLVADEDKENTISSFLKVKETGIVDTEGKFISKSKQVRDLRIRAIKLSDTRILGFIEDITAQVKAEKELITSEKRFISAQQMAHVGNWELTVDTNIIWGSEEAFNIYGIEYSSGYLDLRLVQKSVMPKYRRLLDRALNGLITKNKKYDETYEIKKFNTGELRFVHSRAMLEVDKDGKAVKIIGTIQDITAQVKSETKLIESEKRYRSMYDQAATGIFTCDLQGDIIDANKKFCDVLGYCLEDIKTFTYLDITHPDDIEQSKKRFTSLINGETDYVYAEKRHVNKNGKIIDVILSASLIKDTQGKAINIIATTQDITEQKRNKKNYELMIKTAMDGFLLFDLKANILDANDYYCKLIGYTREELLTMSLVDLKVFEENDDLEKLTYKTINESPMRYESKHRHKNGTIIDVEISSNYLPGSSQFFVFLHDLTEEKRLEEEKRQMDAHLAQQQRLESIGTLAGGVAHEINNPINGIMNYAQLILDAADGDSENAEFAKEIVFESERIANIVKNLLQFSRQEKQEYSYAKIEDIIGNTLSLVKTVIKHDQIDLQVDITKGLPDIRCRSQQIQQVIMNLLTNARDTLNEKYAGYHENKIVKLTCEQFNKQKRKWIRITVEDHGNGIPKSAQEKLFEPFFTTKERDKGTGLGLPISHGIVKDHRGELTFETEEGSYTRFYLDLPVDNGWEL